MSIRDDILGHLANGPAKTSAIAEALALEISQVSPALSGMKNEGRVERDAETQEWSLVAGNGSVERLPTRRGGVAAKPRVGRRAKDPHEIIADKLENQEAWAQEALDEYLKSIGDERLPVLLDNLAAAKAARVAWDATAEGGEG